MARTSLGSGGLDTVSAEAGQFDFDETRLNAVLPALEGELQSGIVLPHARLHSRYVFLRFAGGAAAAKRLLGVLVEGFSSIDGERLALTTFRREAAVEPIALSLLLTASGYRRLGFEPRQLFGAGSFTKGPRSPETLNELLDPPLVDWDIEYREGWDALVLLSGDEPSRLERARSALVAQIVDNGVVTPSADGTSPDLHVESGNVLDREGKPSASIDEQFEIFGFRDGLSQPVFLPEHWASIREAQYGSAPPVAGADPRCSLSVVLAEDPLGSAFVDPCDERRQFGLGSFFVFRKLAQDYRGFAVRTALYTAEVEQRRDFMERLYAGKAAAGQTSCESNPYARDLTADAKRFVLTSSIGREPDGCPTGGRRDVLHDRSRDNAFDFEDDPHGSRCPFTAHIRKANPRGGTGDLRKERSRRIARRGMPYGQRSEDGRLRGGAGLLFLCCQADIARQFEHVQGVWLNGRIEHDAEPTPGIDSLVGQTRRRDRRERRPEGYGSPFGRRDSAPEAIEGAGKGERDVRHAWLNQTVVMNFDFQDYVELRGAEYLFAPSMSGLKKMIRDATDITSKEQT